MCSRLVAASLPTATSTRGSALPSSPGAWLTSHLNIAAVAFPRQLSFCLLSNIGRQWDKRNAGHVEQLLLAIDTLLSFGIVSSMIWTSRIATLPAPMIKMWEVSVIANILGVGNRSCVAVLAHPPRVARRDSEFFLAQRSAPHGRQSRYCDRLRTEPSAPGVRNGAGYPLPWAVETPGSAEPRVPMFGLKHRPAIPAKTQVPTPEVVATEEPRFCAAGTASTSGEPLRAARGPTNMGQLLVAEFH